MAGTEIKQRKQTFQDEVNHGVELAVQQVEHRDNRLPSLQACVLQSDSPLIPHFCGRLVTSTPACFQPRYALTVTRVRRVTVTKDATSLPPDSSISPPVRDLQEVSLNTSQVSFLRPRSAVMFLLLQLSCHITACR